MGWEKLWVHGIRTVVDLRNDDELNRDAVARPSSLNTVRIAHDAVEDTLGSLDVEARLRDGGLTESDLAALRERMPTPSAAVCLDRMASAPHVRAGLGRRGIPSGRC